MNGKQSSQWFWEYEIICNYEDYNPECRHGIVYGDTFSDAMLAIEEYYGTDIVEIHLLRPLMQTVFEFEAITSDSPECTFSIVRKKDLSPYTFGGD